MKKLIAPIATLSILSIVGIGSSWSGLATASYNEGTTAHIDSKLEFPHNKWAIVRQTIQVHVPKNGQNLEQLSIEIPAQVELLASNVEITDSRDRLIIAPTAVRGRRLEINFNPPIASGNRIRINLNGVKRTMLVKSPVYMIFGTPEHGSEILIGEAYFPI